MFIKEIEFFENEVIEIAKDMCIAAKTAPKGKGLDSIKTAILTGDEKNVLGDMMQKIGTDHNLEFFVRDSVNVKNSMVIVLIGVIKEPKNTSYCGFCGFENCSEMEKNNAKCSLNNIDLGIAIGSAVSVATNNHVDNRIMFTIGRAAMEVSLLGDEIGEIIGIPLSVSNKNIYFDRS